jgi:hypothetical protein
MIDDHPSSDKHSVIVQSLLNSKVVTVCGAALASCSILEWHHVGLLLVFFHLYICHSLGIKGSIIIPFFQLVTVGASLKQGNVAIPCQESHSYCTSSQDIFRMVFILTVTQSVEGFDNAFSKPDPYKRNASSEHSCPHIHHFELVGKGFTVSKGIPLILNWLSLGSRIVCKGQLQWHLRHVDITVDDSFEDKLLQVPHISVCKMHFESLRQYYLLSKTLVLEHHTKRWATAPYCLRLIFRTSRRLSSVFRQIIMQAMYKLVESTAMVQKHLLKIFVVCSLQQYLLFGRNHAVRSLRCRHQSAIFGWGQPLLSEVRNSFIHGIFQ